jgi:hypothetical protein
VLSRDTLTSSGDLVEGRPAAPKYARDFLRLIELVRTDEVERIWQEHRKRQSPQASLRLACSCAG